MFQVSTLNVEIGQTGIGAKKCYHKKILEEVQFRSVLACYETHMSLKDNLILKLVSVF